MLLAQMREGDPEAARQLAPMVYRELRRIAGALMQRESPSHTLQATALVHEVFLRLMGGESGEWQNRAHFLGSAAQAMRQILLDHARRRHAEKRGGKNARKVDLDAELLVDHASFEDIIAIDQALTKLQIVDPRQSRLVELRFFAGLNMEETAEVMGVSPVTVKREWRLARAWLHRELTTAWPA